MDCFAEPFFDFLERGVTSNNVMNLSQAERTKTMIRLKLIFDLFKIELNAKDVENMIFSRNYNNKRLYKQTITRLVVQREAEQRQKGSNYPYRFSIEPLHTCNFCSFQTNSERGVLEHCTLGHYGGRFGRSASGSTTCPYTGKKILSIIKVDQKS